MADLLIAVGGSGQHVALAVSRLVLLGLMEPMDLIVIDADSASPLARQLLTLDGMVDSQSGIKKHVLTLADGNGFKAPYPADLAAQAADGGVNFGSLLEAEGESPWVSEVREAIFAQDELNQDVRSGFYAKPCLGASAVSLFGGDSGLIYDLRARASGAQRVFVTGSFIGGTGAGVLPSLVVQLADSQKWHGVFLLEWLAPTAGDGGAITGTTMKTNALHGLSYFYADMRERLKVSALIGPPGGNVHRTYSAAAPNPNEAETNSLYPLIAAGCIQQIRASNAPSWNGAVHSYGLPDNQPDALLDQEWNSKRTLRNALFAERRLCEALSLYAAGDADSEAAVSSLKSCFSKFGGRAGAPLGLQESISAYGKSVGMGSGLLNDRRSLFVDELMPKLAFFYQQSRALLAFYEQVFADAGGLGPDNVWLAIKQNRRARLDSAWARAVAEPSGNQTLQPAQGAQELARLLVEQLRTACAS